MERGVSALTECKVTCELRHFLWCALTATTLSLAPQRALSQEAAAEARFQFLPVGLLYDPYRAGDKEPRSTATLVSRSGGPIYLDAVLGGRFGVVRQGTEGPAGTRAWQLDVEGAAFPRLNLRHISKSVESVDFRFGFPLTGRYGPVAVKLGYYHLSSHVGDEYLERNPGAVRRNYVRDAVAAGITYDLTGDLSVYGETGYAFYTSGGAKPWELQMGGEFHLPLERCWCGTPFLAAHGHLREEVDYGGSVTIVAGSEWRSPDGDRRLGFGLLYFDGYSNQYQFFDRQEELIGLTFWLGH